MKNQFCSLLRSTVLQRGLLFLLFVAAVSITAAAQQKLRVVIAGLNHDHVHGILHAYQENRVIVVGIAEPNKTLWKKYSDLYGVPDSLFTADLATSL